eukprot:3725408-Pyramimonas_sp.AAC.1
MRGGFARRRGGFTRRRGGFTGSIRVCHIFPRRWPVRSKGSGTTSRRRWARRRIASTGWIASSTAAIGGRGPSHRRGSSIRPSKVTAPPVILHNVVCHGWLSYVTSYVVRCILTMRPSKVAA